MYHAFHKNIKQPLLFQLMIIIRNIFEHQISVLKMISEGLCDNEDWVMMALSSEINY